MRLWQLPGHRDLNGRTISRVAETWRFRYENVELGENIGKFIRTARRIEPSLALLRANRQHIVELVKQTPDAWEKSIRVKWSEGEEERITIGDVLEMQASHVVGHINDIRMIRQAHIPRITS